MVEEGDYSESPTRGINQINVEVKYKHRSRDKKKYAPPAVQKPFFKELDEASIDLKRVLQASRVSHRDGSVQNDEETLGSGSRIKIRQIESIARHRREARSVQGSTNYDSQRWKMSTSPGDTQTQRHEDTNEEIRGIYYTSAYRELIKIQDGDINAKPSVIERNKVSSSQLVIQQDRPAGQGRQAWNRTADVVGQTVLGDDSILKDELRIRMDNGYREPEFGCDTVLSARIEETNRHEVVPGQGLYEP